MNKSYLFKFHISNINFFHSHFYSNKILFKSIFLIIFLSMISIFLTNFIHLWILMEINTMIFIILMSMYMKKFKSTFNFFIIQSISSIMLIFLLMMKNYSFLPHNLIFNLLLILSFTLKLGLFPFFYWPPLINLNLNWILIFIMSTSQKFIPLLIFNMFFNQIKNELLTNSFILISILSSFISTIMNFNETNFKKILTFSSTNHLSWMIFISIFDSSMFLIYFIIYSLSMMFLCFIFNKFNMNTFMDLTKIQFFNYKKINFSLSMNLLIISALPPFLTFLIKINSMKIMIENFSLFSSLLFSLISIFTIIFYMNLVIKMNMFYMIKNKFYFNLLNIKFNFFSLMIINLMSMAFLFITFYLMN
uniref:NADH dehydrogenase subunit 2 n=1 Tax=Provespa barthelemyi TaxID=743389 RepID=UPI002552036A|nr:NADH dehydrogenase subunit 2 [Provespa barthelemyi]WGL39457.1 NADH dehydrogenase subunit 2 [Provespa barthelemyi]